MGGWFFLGGGIRSQKRIASEFLFFSFFSWVLFPLLFLKKKLLPPSSPAPASRPRLRRWLLSRPGADESISELSADCSESQARRPAARSGAEAGCAVGATPNGPRFGAAAAATSAELDTTAASATLCGCSKVASPSFEGGLSLLGGTATVETKKER